ncbi:hypothetical protein BJ912DRAFT_859713, partial [Pholiota molesta]
DYPTSASIISDRANVRKRGTTLAYIFSSQGWGTFVGSLVTIIVLLCYAIGVYLYLALPFSTFVRYISDFFWHLFGASSLAFASSQMSVRSISA